MKYLKYTIATCAFKCNISLLLGRMEARRRGVARGGGCSAPASGPSTREWRALGELRWRGSKAGGGALVQCREGMAAGRTVEKCSSKVATVENATPAQGTRGDCK
jgi:hypothetical protein